MAKNFDEKTDELGGKAKEAFGDATNNESLKNEGKADQTLADAKEKLGEAGDAIKDGVNKVAGKFQDGKK